MANEHTKVINLDQDKVCIVMGNEMIEVEPPKTGFGQVVVTWIGGKIDKFEDSATVKRKDVERKVY